MEVKVRLCDLKQETYTESGQAEECSVHFGSTLNWNWQINGLGCLFSI